MLFKYQCYSNIYKILLRCVLPVMSHWFVAALLYNLNNMNLNPAVCEANDEGHVISLKVIWSGDLAILANIKHPAWEKQPTPAATRLMDSFWQRHTHTHTAGISSPLPRFWRSAVKCWSPLHRLSPEQNSALTNHHDRFIDNSSGIQTFPELIAAANAPLSFKALTCFSYSKSCLESCSVARAISFCEQETQLVRGRVRASNS